MYRKKLDSITQGNKKGFWQQKAVGWGRMMRDEGEEKREKSRDEDWTRAGWGSVLDVSMIFLSLSSFFNISWIKIPSGNPEGHLRMKCVCVSGCTHVHVHVYFCVVIRSLKCHPCLQGTWVSLSVCLCMCAAPSCVCAHVPILNVCILSTLTAQCIYLKVSPMLLGACVESVMFCQTGHSSTGMGIHSHVTSWARSVCTSN